MPEITPTPTPSRFECHLPDVGSYYVTSYYSVAKYLGKAKNLMFIDPLCYNRTPLPTKTPSSTVTPTNTPTPTTSSPLTPIISGSWSNITPIPNLHGGAPGSSWHSVHYWSKLNRWYALYHTGAENSKGLTASAVPAPTSWTQLTLPASAYWFALASDSSYLYALGEYSVGYRSTNGSSWTPMGFTTSHGWTEMKKLGNILFVSDPRAVGGNRISTNQGQTSAQLFSSDALYDMDYDGVSWIALVNNSTTAKITMNGTSWSNITIPSTNGNSWTRITHGGNKWVVYNRNTLQASISNGTSDGLSWNLITLPAKPSEIIFYKNLYWLFVSDGTKVYYTNNFSNWQTMNHTALNSPAVGAGNNRIVAFGNFSTTSILSPAL